VTPSTLDDFDDFDDFSADAVIPPYEPPTTCILAEYRIDPVSPKGAIAYVFARTREAWPDARVLVDGSEVLQAQVSAQLASRARIWPSKQEGLTNCLPRACPPYIDAEITGSCLLLRGRGEGHIVAKYIAGLPFWRPRSDRLEAIK